MNWFAECAYLALAMSLGSGHLFGSKRIGRGEQKNRNRRIGGGEQKNMRRGIEEYAEGNRRIG